MNQRRQLSTPQYRISKSPDRVLTIAPEDAPVHRAFFVIDRTGAVEQMKNLTAFGINPVSGTTFSFVPNTNTTGVRANMNGIRWKDLVQFRQTLN